MLRELGAVEIEDEILARTNPETGDIEGLEILLWSKRLEPGEHINLPMKDTLRVAAEVYALANGLRRGILMGLRS